jgi:hypothetical protein
MLNAICFLSGVGGAASAEKHARQFYCRSGVGPGRAISLHDSLCSDDCRRRSHEGLHRVEFAKITANVVRFDVDYIKLDCEGGSYPFYRDKTQLAYLDESYQLNMAMLG